MGIQEIQERSSGLLFSVGFADWHARISAMLRGRVADLFCFYVCKVARRSTGPSRPLPRVWRFSGVWSLRCNVAFSPKIGFRTERKPSISSGRGSARGRAWRPLAQCQHDNLQGTSRANAASSSGGAGEGLAFSSWAMFPRLESHRQRPAA